MAAAENLSLTWVNGIDAGHVDLADRGLAYGDGLFETIRLHHGEPVWLPQHLVRLSRGADRLQIPVDMSQLMTEIEQFLQPVSCHGVLKLMVTRGSGGRGYAPPLSGDAAPVRVLGLYPLPVYPGEPATNGIALFPCQTRLAHQPLLAGLKHLNRLEQVLARAELKGDEANAAAGQHPWLEGVCRDYDDHIICGTMSNIFVRADNSWFTPRLDRCGIEGICRRFVMDTVERQGEQVAVQNCNDQLLLQASEVFVCNSVFGIWPVTEFVGHRWPVGKATQKIQQSFNEVLNG
ncbi:aminodeoxychorismate lyase [Endozoicomonadaceae bacterium StTr2]